MFEVRSGTGGGARSGSKGKDWEDDWNPIGCMQLKKEEANLIVDPHAEDKLLPGTEELVYFVEEFLMSATTTGEEDVVENNAKRNDDTWRSSSRGPSQFSLRKHRRSRGVILSLNWFPIGREFLA